MRFVLAILTLVMAVAGFAQVKQFSGATPIEEQLRLIESAAPPDVVKNATIYVLQSKGYVKHRQGSNGFSCLVLRERPDTVEPECYDAEGSATLLAADLYLEAERAKGRADETIKAEIEKGFKTGRFKAPRKPGIVYMLSPSNRVYDPESKQVISFPGHLMFYAPYATAKDVGSGPGAPYLVNPGKASTLMIVVPAGAGKH
jgi:hypothetical protein